MKSYAWKFLRLKFSQLFFSCYVRILEQRSKIHGEKSQSQLWWSISDFRRALLVTSDFDSSDALLEGTSRSGLQKSPASPLCASGVARAFLGCKYANYTLKVNNMDSKLAY